jgi:tetratricopeptide (TPR) repeat protein
MEQRFTLGEVERITGTSRRQLKYWSRLGLLRPSARWGERFFNFADLVAVDTLSRLADRRVPAGRLRKAIRALEERFGGRQAEIASLRISTNGEEIVVHDPTNPEGLIEPLTGQFVLNFETEVLDRKVRSLRERTAEDWFDLGMTWDTNPATMEDAVGAYREAIASMPKWVEAHINLGTTLFQLGRIEEARDAFAAAVQLEQHNPLAHFNLGCAHDRLGETASAIEDFCKALTRAPNMADAHLNLALAYEKTSKKAAALEHYSQYLRYEPRGAWAEFVRARLNHARRPTPAGKVTPFRDFKR